ncbi:MAG TPA: glycosyltransferase 87 family protein, partial [Candidatus Limnocylindrales bacterium]
DHPASARAPRRQADHRFVLALAALVGAIGWLGIAWIGLQLLALDPPRAGDDLRLLLDAAGRAAADQPLYLAEPPGTTLQASSLFYSYPPIVAQALVPLAGLPFVVVLVGWGAAATACFLAVVRALDSAGRNLVRQVAVGLPFVFPFAITLLFGNANAWFPLVFGLGILAVLRPDRRTAGIAGIALALGAAVKLHPASVGIWWLVRWLRDRRRGSAGTVVVAGVVAGVVALLLSVLVGGTGPWIDYVAFIRSVTQTADLVSPLNIGPASQVALLLGGSEATARLLQVPVTLAAVGITIVAAFRPRDPVEGLAWAVTASLVVLPVTWFHYPTALVPFAVAALARRDGAPQPGRVSALLAGAMAAAALAIVAPVAVWLAVALVLAAVRVSRPAQAADTAALPA